MAKGLSAAKAKKILTDGYVKGKPLTAKQRKYFGAIASGATPLKAINGGWLDKYEDGRDVEKAQDGTEVEETLTVESKDDPRYKAYQDSLEVYNDYKKVQKSLLKNNYKLERHSVSNPDYLAMKKKMLKEKGIDASNWDGEGANILTKRGSKAFEALENLKPKYVKHINKDKYKVLDLQDDMVNTNLPMQLFNKNIDPIGVTEYIDKDKYWTGTSPDNYEFNGTGNLYNVGLNIMGGSQDVRSVFNYSNAKPRQKVVVEQNSQKDRIETKLPPSKETPKRPIEEPLSQLDSYGIEPFKPNLELLTSGDIEAQPIYQHKPYNQNDKPIPLGLLQKMGIENPESQGFHYIKELNGNFKTMQTREAYRKDNLRPNNTEYKNGGGVPKAQGGKALKWFKDMYDGAKKFDSSIDWRKWVKYTEDFDNNPDVIKHLNEIEKTTKGNGTWMKNPDGSAFKGTQEEFVVQQSDNYKKAFPNPVVDDAGNIQMNYHGSPNEFTEFDPNKFYSGSYGRGVYTSPDKELILKSYANPDKKRVDKIRKLTNKKAIDNTDKTHLYELYINSKNPKNYDDILDYGDHVGNIKNFGKTVDDVPSLQDFRNSIEGNDWLKELSDEKLLNYIESSRISPVKENFTPVLEGVDFLNVPSTRLKEQVTPFSNRLKSAKGNILFDMTNPNIYKAIVPGAIGAGAVSQMGPKQEDGQFKNGGWLDKYEDGGDVEKAQMGKIITQAQNAGEDVQNAQQDVQNRAVIFAEAPEYRTHQYNIGTPIYDSKGNLIANYPSELETLYNNYNQSEAGIEDINNKKIAEKKASSYLQFLIHERGKMKDQQAAMWKEWEKMHDPKNPAEPNKLLKFEEKYKNLGDQIVQFKKQINKRERDIDKKYNPQLDELYLKNSNAYTDFYNNERNSQINSTDSTFYKEAQNLQRVYEKLQPNTNVEIVPIFRDPDTMREKVADLNKNDAMFLFGHSGSRLGGIPNTEIANIFQESKAENCYLGSCDFEENVEPYTNMVNKNLNYRPSGAWWGVNPNGSTIDEAMWSRVTDPTTGNIDPTVKRTAKIITPTLGVDYQTKKLKTGGWLDKYENGGEVPKAQMGALKKLWKAYTKTPTLALPPRKGYGNANLDQVINTTANTLRNKGVGTDAYDVAEAIGHNVDNSGIPENVYRGVTMPLTEEGMSKLSNRRVMDYSQVGAQHLMTNNEGMLKMQEYAVAPDLARFQGISGNNIGNSNYMINAPWTSNKQGALPYATTRKKIVNNSDGSMSISNKEYQDEIGNLPQGMLQEFAVNKNKSLFGVNSGAIGSLSDLMSKKLGKPINQITLKESEEFARNWGIDYFKDKGFKGVPEYQFMPGKTTPTSSKFIFKEGGTIPKAQNGNFGGVNTDIRTTSGEPAYDDTVYPDDPNYDAKYKETYEGGAFASMPNQLDEVVLNSGVDYEKYPLYDDLSEQDRQYFKDDGAIGRGVRRRAQTKKGLAEDTYDVVNPLMYGMLGVAGGMMAGPSIANLTRAAAPYVVSTARTIGNSPVGVGIRKALNYKPMGGPASLGNMMDAGFADMALRDTPEMYDAFKENPNWDTGTDLALTASDLIPYGEIATGFKGTRRLINSAANKFNDLTSLKPNFTPFENNAGKVGISDLFNVPISDFTNPLSSIRSVIGEGLERYKTQGNLKQNPFWKGFSEDPVSSAAEFNKSWTNAPGFDERYKKFMYSAQDPDLIKEREDIQNLYNYSLASLKRKQPGLFTNTSTNINMFNDPKIAGRILDDELDTPLKEISKMFPRLKSEADLLSSLKTQKVRLNKTLNSAANADSNLEQIKKTGRFTEVFDTSDLSPEDLKYFEDNKNVLGFFTSGDNRAIVNRDQAIKHYGNNPEKLNARIRSIIGHEDSHVLDIGGRATKPVYDITISQAIPQIINDGKNVRTGVTNKKIDEIWPTFKNLPESRQKMLAYLSEPTEVAARIKELRMQFIPKEFIGTDKQYEMTDDLINKIISEGKKGNTSVDSSFFRLIKDKDAFKNLFKALPAIVPVGVGLNAASQKKNGGVIKDDMGQWAHPGEITEISGNTMATHGYGDNPLYVVPDVGEPRVVEANTGTQTFPGATKFTEYPMAKNGSSLVELNQLTNFTNYNTPQPGGWLDKYN